jgi:hypothetical protein
VDIFAKVFYSTVLTDLGEGAQGNGLVSANGLDYLRHHPDVNAFNPEFPVPAGDLGVQPTTIFGQYICSVPKQKDAGTLFVSILIADLVFLQTAWMIFNYLVQWYLEVRDPTMNHCVACLHAVQDSESTSGKGGYQMVAASTKLPRISVLDDGTRSSTDLPS